MLHIYSCICALLLLAVTGLFEDTYVKHLALDNLKSNVEKGKTFTLVEFYAPWCPHCQHFDPYLQAVAKEFSSSKEADISLFHVDCKQQRKLCIDYFHVAGYPSVYVGKKDEVLKAFESKKNTLKKIAAEHDTGKLAAALNELTGASVTITTVVTPFKPSAAAQSSVTTRVESYANIQEDDILKATAYVLKFAEDLVGRSLNHEKAIDAFITEMSKSFPLRRCRQSLSTLAFEPRPKATGNKYMIPTHWEFCNMSWDNLDALKWKGCLGSTKQSRGYTCGLWNLFHSMLINGASFAAIRNYIKYYFGCKDCQRHFLEATRGFEMFTTSSAASAMYMWKIHNNVNHRIKNQPDTDPRFPKAQWPMKSLCPSCRRADNSFNVRKVYRFLNFYYKGDGDGDFCSQIIDPHLCMKEPRCRVNDRLCLCELRGPAKRASLESSTHYIEVKHSHEFLPHEMKESSDYGSGVFSPHQETALGQQVKLPESCAREVEFFEQYLDISSKTYVQQN